VASLLVFPSNTNNFGAAAYPLPAEAIPTDLREDNGSILII